METLIQQEQQAHVSAAESKITYNTKTASLWENLEFNRFGLTPILVVVVACMGGLAGAFAIQDSPFKLALVVLSTGLAEAAMLAVLPMRVIAMAATISVIISMLTIIF